MLEFLLICLAVIVGILLFFFLVNLFENRKDTE